LLDAKASPENFAERLRKLGAKPGSLNDTTHQMTIANGIEITASMTSPNVLITGRESHAPTLCVQ